MSTRGLRTRALIAATALVAGLGGCMTRHVNITSEPSGATVTVNDLELGRTPLTADFTYYGVYDVLVTMPGYEPLRAKARARAPLQEYPPVDLAASASPLRLDHEVRWHFELTPSLERSMAPEDFERGLLERARTLRERTAENR